MKVKFFNPGLMYWKIRPEMLNEIDRVLQAGDLILRKDVEQFEKTLAEYVGTKYAVALNSCTDALYLALRALKIGPGDEVLVPSRTFVASAQVIVQVGATPVYYDLDGFSSQPFSDKIKAVIPVHIEGAFDGQFDDIIKSAAIHNWYVIEDAAQALGATLNGKKAGSIGDAGCFSFYPAKILGAYGDAGALVTDNEEIYKYVHDCRNHFKDDARDWGINSRMDNLQAAILNVKFRYLGGALARRKEIALLYTMQLPLEILPQDDSEGRVWQDYIIRTPRRDELYEFLKSKEIETLKNNYPFPVPKMPLAQKYEDETLRLPCNELLTDAEVDEVIKNVNEFFGENKIYV
jgi:UDP-2-acetamido-2-deoxy-ribo-hexuluronate aminotransferase